MSMEGVFHSLKDVFALINLAYVVVCIQQVLIVLKTGICRGSILRKNGFSRSSSS